MIVGNVYIYIFFFLRIAFNIKMYELLAMEIIIFICVILTFIYF